MKLSYKISSRIQVSLLSIVILCTGCSGKRDSVELPEADRRFVYKGELKSFPLDSIAERLWSFIPETNDNALLGGLERVIMHDSILYIYDNMKQVVAFDTKGKHIFTIHNIGGGPGEYTHLDDIAIDKKNNQLLLVSDTKIISYNLDGTYAGEERPIDEYIHEIVVDDDVAYAKLSTYSDLILKPNILRIMNLSNEKTLEYMPTLPEYAPFCTFKGRTLNFTGDGRVHFMRKFDNNIYLLNPNSYKAEYYIDWGDSWFFPDEDVQYECREINKKCFQEKKIYTLYNFQEGDSIITLSTNYPGFYYGDKSTGDLYRVLRSMDTEFNMPLGRSTPVDGTDGIIVFELQYFLAEEMLEMSELGNEKFRELFSKMNEDSNSILIFYKLK